MHSLPLLNLLTLLTLTLTLPPAVHTQAFAVFAYYLQNTDCTAHVPRGSAKSQTIITSEEGQCVPVIDTALGGTFDVRISERTYWTNGVTPALLACPTVDCDLFEKNGCYEMWGVGKWPGTAVCKRMSKTHYWAIGPMGFNLKERGRLGGTSNGSYANATAVETS